MALVQDCPTQCKYTIYIGVEICSTGVLCIYLMCVHTPWNYGGLWPQFSSGGDKFSLLNAFHPFHPLDFWKANHLITIIKQNHPVLY